MFQERKYRDLNWEPSPVPPGDIDFLLLTHSHVDHVGLVPRLVKNGYGQPIYATRASAEIARIVLLDAAHIQEEDAELKRRRHRREGRKGRHPEVPLYTRADEEGVEPGTRRGARVWPRTGAREELGQLRRRRSPLLHLLPRVSIANEAVSRRRGRLYL